MQFDRRTFLAGAAALAAAYRSSPIHAQGPKVLRIGMTAADIPQMTSSPDNGFEGYRFTGYTLFDALVNWDLSSADKASGLVPGLAESWEVNPADKTKWIIKLRRGVKFHDGSDFNADAVVWNYDKLFKRDAPQFDARQVSLVGFRAPSVAGYRKIDEYTVEFSTKTPDSFLPYQICYILMASPKQWEALGRDWAKFHANPSGTGPFKLASFTPRQRAELVPNPTYWDPRRRPKVDRVVLLPLPEPNARTAALLSGQVDWIEQPSPDALPRLRQGGMVITSNGYPHIWPYHLSFVDGSPWRDIRVRKAANLAIDRAGMVELLGGMAVPAKGHVLPDSPWFGRPSFEVKYDKAAALKLMQEAGYSPQRPLSTKFLISASGSGQMLPLQMNEYVQQNLAEIGIKVEFIVVEWQALLDRWRAGAKSDQVQGATTINVSYTTQDPFSGFTRFLRSDLHAPAGVNWGYYSDPEMDRLLAAAQSAFTGRELDAAIAKVHEKMVNDALFVWVVHDVGPRAMSPHVKGYVQAKNWFQDIAPVTME